MAEENNDFWGKGPSDKSNTPRPDSGLRDQAGQSQPTFYAKEGGEAQKPQAEGGFWSKAESAQASAAAEREDLLKDPSRPIKRRRRIIRNILLSTLAVILLILVVGGALAPNIASSLAPKYAPGFAADSISGTLALDSADFSWGGPQRVEGVKLTSKDGSHVATLSAQTDASLWSLISGSLNLGDVVISDAKVSLVRQPDGSTNLETALAPPGKPKPAPTSKGLGHSAPPTLPKDLRAKVVIKKLDATFTDKSSPAPVPPVVTLSKADLTADVAPGETLKLKLTAEAFLGLAKPPAGAGSIAIDATIDRWSADDGSLTLNKAKGKANVTLHDFPMQVVDVLAGPASRPAKGPPVPWSAALGPSLELTIAAEGDAQDARADLAATLANANAKGTLHLTPKGIDAATPIELTGSGTALRALLPGLDAAFDPASTARLDALPGVTCRIENFHSPLPSSEGLDLRGASGTITLQIAETTGKVALEPGAAPKPFRIAPLTLTAETKDLSTGAHVTASTVATLDAQPAGEIALDITAAGLIDAKGAPIGMPGSIQGSASIKGIASAIAQPFVQSTGLDLPTDLGPTIDLTLAAATESGAANAPLAIDLTLTSQGLRAKGGLVLSPDALRLKPGGLTLDIPNAGSIASRFVKPDTGWALAPLPGSTANVALAALVVPRDANGWRLDKASGSATLQASGLRLRALPATPPTAAPKPPATPPPATPGVEIDLATLRTSAELRAGAGAHAQLAADATSRGSPFTLAATLDVPALFAPGSASTLIAPLALRPDARIEVTDAPPALVAALLPPKPGAPLDTGRLVADALGGPFKASVVTKSVPGDAGALDITLQVQAPSLGADAGAVINSAQASLRATTVGVQITPAALDTLLRAFAPSVAGGSSGDVRLAGPAQLRASLAPIVIPLDEHANPKLDSVGTATAEVSIQGRTIVNGLAATDSNAAANTKPRPLGPLGVENVMVRATVPVGALVAPAPPDRRAVSARVSAALLGNAGTAIADINGTLSAEISDAKPVGPFAADLTIRKISTEAVERIAGQEGLLTGLLGEFADLELTASIAPAAAKDAPAPPMDVQLAITAPRLKSDGPVALSFAQDHIALVKPAKLSLEPDVPTINRFLSGSGAGGTPGGKSLQLRQSSPVTLELAKIHLPRATPGAPNANRPDIAVSLALASANFASAEGQAIRLGTTSIALSTPAPLPGQKPPASQPVAFRLEIAEAAVGDTPPAKNMALVGLVTDLFAPDGSINLATARLSVHGDLPAVPTALVDALANQKGALVEGLGPTLAIKVDADRVPLATQPGTPPATTAPSVQFSASADRAHAEVRGVVDGPVFAAQEPVKVTIAEMTRLFARRFIGVTPLLGEISKTKDDAPGLISASNLRAPLDGDLSKLNGDIVVDPGQCRFQTSGAFANVLKSLNQKTEGAVGTRLDPLPITVRSGVATYPMWKVPLGDFTVIMQADKTVEAAGVDLVNRQVDVIVWIPVGALTDKAAGQLNTGLGSLLSKAPVLDVLTMTPWRIKGPMDKPEAKLDTELWAKTAVKKLSPEKLLKEGLGDLLKRGATPPAPTAPATPPTLPR